MAMAVDLGLDWIRVPVAWKELQASRDGRIRLEMLDPIMQAAECSGIAVLVSVSDPPGWAVTASGPDPEQAARFLLGLARRYPAALRAVELFPGANTRQSWGAQPDPADYYALFQQVDRRLRGEAAQVLLVAAGLRPLPALPPAGGVDDLVYLRGLYRLGAARLMPVISLQFTELAGEPLLLPDEHERRVLRHYETVRQVMVENGHQSGLIWVTHLSPPSGTIRVADSEFRNSEAQARWLSQAYAQLRSQLYVGVAFLPSLNSKGEGTAEEVPSLSNDSGEPHPLYPVMHDMIRRNQAGSIVSRPGQAKEGSFTKMRP
jgi:hypothetical protein